MQDDDPAYDIFPQHRSKRIAPIAAARKRRAARSFELHISPDALLVDNLTEKDGTSIAQLRHEMAELVPGVSHRDRFSGLRYDPPGEHFKPFRPGKPVGIQPKIECKFGIHTDQPRCSHR
jgi:hypothetical protein